jgi:ribosome maturation factor RimP
MLIKDRMNGLITSKSDKVLTYKELREQLKDFVTSLLLPAGFQLVDMVIKDGRKLAVEIVVDREGGISLDECAALNRQVVSWLEEKQNGEGDFIVDVCSPGLDRELKSETSYKWATGKNVKVYTFAPVDGERHITGTLSGRSESGDITICAEDKDIFIEKKNVAKIRLWTDLGAGSKSNGEKK